MIHLLWLIIASVWRCTHCVTRTITCSVSTTGARQSFKNAGRFKGAKTSTDENEQSIEEDEDDGFIKVTPLPKYFTQGSEKRYILPSSSISINVIIEKKTDDTLLEKKINDNINSLLSQFCNDLQLTSTSVSSSNMSIASKTSPSLSLLQSIDIVLLPTDPETSIQSILSHYVNRNGDPLVDINSISRLPPHQISNFYAFYMDMDAHQATSFVGIKLLAFDAVGIQYGLSTLTQLLSQSQIDRRFRMTLHAPVALPLLIRDWPVYPWRGEKIITYNNCNVNHYITTCILYIF
jgi:hypothetical protein